MYTAQDVLQYFHGHVGVQNHRKRVYIDPRNYAIALLCYKFQYTESELEGVFGVDRCTIHYSKTQPYYHMKTGNEVFMENAAEFIKKFPYTFPDPVGKKRVNRVTQRVIVNLDVHVYKTLKIKADRDGVYVSTVIKEMLDKVMKVWEE
jgi:hypothetical protein